MDRVSSDKIVNFLQVAVVALLLLYIGPGIKFVLSYGVFEIQYIFVLVAFFLLEVKD